MTIQYDYYIKVLFLGDVGTGKTNIISNFCGNNFDEIHIPTIGLDFKTTFIDLDNLNNNPDNSKIKVQLIDCSGNERFMSLLKNFSKKSEILIMVYDVTKRNSLDNIEKWYKLLQNFNYNFNDDLVKILIGNKKDLTDSIRVGYNDGKALADKYGMIFYDVSCKTENLRDIILINNCRKVIENSKKNEEQKNEAENTNLLLYKKKKSKKCCVIL